MVKIDKRKKYGIMLDTETDKVYAPTGEDYSAVYENYTYYDNLLNVRREK